MREQPVQTTSSESHFPENLANSFCFFFVLQIWHFFSKNEYISVNKSDKKGKQYMNTFKFWGHIFIAGNEVKRIMFISILSSEEALVCSKPIICEYIKEHIDKKRNTVGPHGNVDCFFFFLKKTRLSNVTNMLK